MGDVATKYEQQKRFRRAERIERLVFKKKKSLAQHLIERTLFSFFGPTNKKKESVGHFCKHVSKSFLNYCVLSTSMMSVWSALGKRHISMASALRH
jgi:hypothetical protein